MLLFRECYSLCEGQYFPKLSTVIALPVYEAKWYKRPGLEWSGVEEMAI